MGRQVRDAVDVPAARPAISFRVLREEWNADCTVRTIHEIEFA